MSKRQDVFRDVSQSLGWSLLSLLSSKPDSDPRIVISSLSITTALSMLAGAASSSTAKAFSTKLQYSNLSDLSQSYAHFAAFSAGSDILSIANGLFHEAVFRPAPQYTTWLANFNAQTQEHANLAAAVPQLNAWIAEHTNGLITDLLSTSALRKAHAVLVNALSFKGTWATQFKTNDTVHDYAFRRSTSHSVNVSMMFRRGTKVNWAQGSGFEAVRLPYDGGFSFVAYLPDEGMDVAQILATFAETAPTLRFAETKIDELGIPRFEIKTESSVMNVLEQFGYPVTGNFDAMGKEGQSQVDDIVHGAAIKVDEEGTIAAAATVVIMTRSMPKKTKSMIFDRPFAFAIRADVLDVMVFSGVFS